MLSQVRSANAKRRAHQRGSAALFPPRRAANRVIEALAVSPIGSYSHMTGSGKTQDGNEHVSASSQSVPDLAASSLAFGGGTLCTDLRRIRSDHRLRDEDVLQRWWGSHELHRASRWHRYCQVKDKVYRSARTSLHDIRKTCWQSRSCRNGRAHPAGHHPPTYAFVLDFSNSGRSFQPRLGLSATSGRTWNDVDEDERLAQFFNQEEG